MIDWRVVVLPIVGAFALALAAWGLARVLRRPLQDLADETNEGCEVGTPVSSAVTEWFLVVPFLVVHSFATLLGGSLLLSCGLGSLLCLTGYFQCTRLVKTETTPAATNAISRRGRLYLSGAILFGMTGILLAVLT